MGPRHNLSFCACKTACLASELLVSMGPSPHVCFLHAKQRLLDLNNKYLRVPDKTCHFVYGKQQHLTHELLVSMGPSPHLWFLHAKQRLWTRITNLYGSQTSPVVLCMQYSVISTRGTCLYGSEPLSVVFGCTTATFGAELQVSMGPRHDLSFCGCKTAWLASEILVSMGPSPHVWFLDAKQRLLDQNNKSLRVPDKSCHFVHGKQQL